MAKQQKTSNNKPNLPDAELDVIGYLWRHGSATARQIREGIESIRPMAHGSVLTLLKRLEIKRLVEHKKSDQGKAFIYRALRSSGPTHRQLVRKLADRVFAGSSTALVASLFESRKPTSAEIEQLQHLLDQLRKDQDHNGEQS